LFVFKDYVATILIYKNIEISLFEGYIVY